MARITANNIEIEYDMRGTGEPMLFIMGLGGQLTDWHPDLIDMFIGRGFQAIRFDNRDAGLSSQTDWEPPRRSKMLSSILSRRPLKGVGYTIADMADDAAALLDALSLDRAHIVGASMGGMIAQEVAIRHPDRVASLCSIMSNTGDRRNGGISASLAAKFSRQKPPTRETAVVRAVEMIEAVSGPHFVAENYRRLAQASVERSFTPHGIARQTAAIAGSRDRTPLLANVTAPALIVHGLADQLVKPSGGIATAKAIPGSRLLAFADMGHDLPRPRWPEIVDAIVRNARHSPALA